jgi:hypothetical protein
MVRIDVAIGQTPADVRRPSWTVAEERLGQGLRGLEHGLAESGAEKRLDGVGQSGGVKTGC